MRNKTENPADAGRHAFEVAGLGLAPFRFIGMSVNRVTYPDGSSKAGGSCDYCGTCIENEFSIRSADGKVSKVGCDCIAKVGDAGLLQAYKTSPEFRAHKRALARAKDIRKTAELDALLADESVKAKLTAMPHPYGFRDRETDRPLTMLDQYVWLKGRCGASGRASLLRAIQKKLANPA